MITGFNTDVKHGDTVYHVQTEDKGVQNPVIESLIYVKGAILDSHRTRYRHFLESEAFSESLLQRILHFQHKQIVSIIKKGQFKKGMALRAFVDGSFVFQLKDGTTEKRYPEYQTGPPPQDQKSAVEKPIPPPVTSPKSEATPLQRPPSPQVPERGQTTNQPETKQVNIIGTDTGSSRKRAEPPTNRIEFAIEAEAAELQGEQGIEICVVGSKDFVGGSHADLELYVQGRQSRLKLENVQVMIKVIGTTFSPRLYAGKTGKDGILRINFTLPSYSVGSAALIIQASTALGSDEIKYLIKRK